jgi:2-methylcitrate dehydratase PrpD
LANETRALAEYAAQLRYDDLPPAVTERAKQCIVDTVAMVTAETACPGAR